MAYLTDLLTFIMNYSNFLPQGMEEVMPAKMILTMTAFQTFWMCALRTTPSASQTSGSFRWCIWTPKERHKLIPTGWSDIKAKSWFRLPILTLVLLWVSMWAFRVAHLVMILAWCHWGNETSTFELLFRFRWVQLCGFQWHFLRQHWQRWRLRWVCVWLSVQRAILRGNVEADNSDVLGRQTFKSLWHLRGFSESGQLHHGHRGAPA